MDYSQIDQLISEDGIDGFFVFYMSLLNGMDIQRMPGQLYLISNHRAPDCKTSFVHSVAQSTRLSTVTFVLQKRFRRVLFQQAKIPLPKAATFSFFSKKDPVKYAEKIGYPVVVKEMFGENPSYGVYGVKTKEELFDGIEKVRRHLPVNSSRAPSSYAQTINLSSAESAEEGSRVKSNSARFVIEKQLEGAAYRVYVIGGKVSCVLSLNKQSNDISFNANDDVAKIAEAAVDSIPGIVNAAVDVLKDKEGNVFLLEFSERLHLPYRSFEKSSFESTCNIYQDVLQNEISLVSGRISSRKKRGTYLVNASGVSDISAFNENLASIMQKSNVALRLGEVCHVVGTVDFQLAGNCFDVAVALENFCTRQNIKFLNIVRKRVFKKAKSHS